MIVRRSTFAGRHSYEIYQCARRCLSQIRLFPLESSKVLPSVSTAKHVTDYNLCRCASTRQQDIVMSVFDRKAKRLHRERASLGCYGENVSVYDYIKDEVWESVFSQFSSSCPDQVCFLSFLCCFVYLFVVCVWGRGVLVQELHGHCKLATQGREWMKDQYLLQTSPSSEGTVYPGMPPL